MIKYLLRRFVTGILLLYIYVSALFFIVQLALPGDYVSHFALSLSTSEMEEARETLGLDKPIFERYVSWLFNLIRGDLGFSFSLGGLGAPVKDLILQTLPATILVFGVGTGLAFLLGSYLGKVITWQRTGWSNGIISLIGISFYTSFPPWLSFLLIYFVASKIGLPAYGLSRTMRISNPSIQQSDILWLMVIALLFMLLDLIIINHILDRFHKKGVRGFFFFGLVSLGWIGSWYLMDISGYAWDILRRSIMPIMTFTLLSFGEIMLLMQTAMQDTLHEDYILTARAKGLDESTIRDRHAARNAILPVISRMITGIPLLLTGMVMIERVLDWQGVGTLLFYAVGTQNITLGLGMLIVIGLISLFLRLVLDVLQLALNPKIRIAKPI